MEICKVKMGLSPSIMFDIFSLSENSSYNLRSSVAMSRRNIRSSKFGFEILHFWIKKCSEFKNILTKDKALEP